MVYVSNKPRKSAHLSTAVEQETKARVLQVAAERNVPYGEVVRMAVEEWLDNHAQETPGGATH